MDREPWEVEAQGYKAGHNPMMGEFNRIFNFAPIPYGHKNHRQFIAKVQTVLADIQYLYFGEIKLDITLYLDEQKRLETPQLADLDNYAKLLCDSLKGPNGLLIDDSQVQSLSISWIDTPHSPHFEIRIKGHPDEFVMKPLSLYEMPDGLFYPISPKSWTKDEIKDMPPDSIELLLAVLYKMTRTKRDFRHMLRQRGSKPLHAFWKSRYISPILTGFHKNRIVDSGFRIFYLKEWKAHISLNTGIARINRVTKNTRANEV